MDSYPLQKWHEIRYCLLMISAKINKSFIQILFSQPIDIGQETTGNPQIA